MSLVTFTLASPKMKYLSTNQTKYVQKIYEANYKIRMNEIKELNKWLGIPCS